MRKTSTPAEVGRRPNAAGAVPAREFDAWLGRTPAAAGLLAPDGRLLGANSEFAAVLSIAAAPPLVGCHLRDLAPELWARLAPLVRWTALTGARTADVAIRRRDGRSRDGMQQWLVRLAPSSVYGSHELRLLVLDVTEVTAEMMTDGDAPTAHHTESPLELRLAPHPDELIDMRRRLTRWLERIGATRDEQSDIVLAAHEAVTNAMRHGGSPAAAALRVAADARQGCVVVHVDDPGHWQIPAPIRLDREGGGRGLAMMQLLMDDVDVHPDNDGTHVRMQRQLCSRVGSTGVGLGG